MLRAAPYAPAGRIIPLESIAPQAEIVLPPENQNPQKFAARLPRIAHIKLSPDS
jgi:hypothetical protein